MADSKDTKKTATATAASAKPEEKKAGETKENTGSPEAAKAPETKPANNPPADDKAKTTVAAATKSEAKLVKCRGTKTHTCRIGKVDYDIQEDKQYSLPQDVASILSQARVVVKL